LWRARWAYLLDENPSFRRWYENLARGSEGTARERARVLFRFLEKQKLTPRSLVDRAMKDRRRVEDLLSDFITELHNENYSPGYIENYLKAVRSWLEFNEIRLVRRIKIGNRNVTPTISDERVPTRRELQQILNYAGTRGRCSIALIALAGLRPQVLGDLRGINGLQIRDLPELRVDGKEVVFTQMPTKIVVRPELNKARHKYLTFLAAEGCEYLKAYFEERLAMGETFTPSSAVIAVKSGYEDTGFRIGSRRSRHLTTKSITKEIRDAMRPRFTWRPYVLRAYFDTQLLVAENHGKISHAYRQFFMGHQGDMEARYTTNKGRLPKDLIEDMRQSFQKCEEYLSSHLPRREEDPEVTTIRTMVESRVLNLANRNVRDYLFSKLGIQDMEVRVTKLRETGLTEETAQANLICNELGIKPFHIEASQPNNGDPKKLVTEEELEQHLTDGWDVQTVLPSGKILVKRDY
jgi:hypothetical protein